MVRAIAAVVVGSLAGLAVWAVIIVVTSGVCSIPILSTLWCTFLPGPGGRIQPGVSLLDVLGLPIFIGVGIAGLWKLWVRGESI